MSDMETMYQDHLKAPKPEPIKVHHGDGWTYVKSDEGRWDVTKWSHRDNGYSVTLGNRDASMEVFVASKDLRSLVRGIIKLMESCDDPEL